MPQRGTLFRGQIVEQITFYDPDPQIQIISADQIFRRSRRIALLCDLQTVVFDILPGGQQRIFRNVAQDHMDIRTVAFQGDPQSA